MIKRNTVAFAQRCRNGSGITQDEYHADTETLLAQHSFPNREQPAHARILHQEHGSISRMLGEIISNLPAMLFETTGIEALRFDRLSGPPLDLQRVQNANIGTKQLSRLEESFLVVSRYCLREILGQLRPAKVKDARQC